MKYEIETHYTIPQGVAGGYRYGKPEGVVIHSSGNDNDSIEGEINYMTQHYQNAFTHAWCDNKKIIEISNTDYACWGAGPNANARFAQIEIVENKNLSDKQHQEAIDRQCFWAAMQCFYYGIEPIDATKNGHGTIWTHKAVSQFLGGTDHNDPIAYIARHGVTWAEMFNQIKGYWNELRAGNDGTAMLGIHEKQGDSVQYRNATPTVYETESGKRPSTKFDTGTAVILTATATHWIKVQHSDGKMSGRDKITDHDRKQTWKVMANNPDGSVSLSCGTKAIFYAYDRDIEAKNKALYRVQTGAYSDPKNAEKQKAELQKQGYKDAFITQK